MATEKTAAAPAHKTLKFMPIGQMKKVLNGEIVEPFVDSMMQDPRISMKLSNAMVLIKISEIIIVSHTEVSNSTKSRNEAIKERMIYLGYLGKIYKNAMYLMGATDYLGSILLLRGIFELLVRISTRNEGEMKERVDSISFLREDEKDNVYRLWVELDAWSNSYGKWIRNVCPVFYGSEHMYHPELFTRCMGYLDIILDFMLTITIEQFEIMPDRYLEKYLEISNDLDMVEISSIQMFHNRLMGTG